MNKDGLKLFALHAAAFVIAAALFVLSFRTPVFGGIGVLFYRGIALIILISILLAGGMLLLKKKSRFAALLTYRDVILSVTLFSCIATVFFTLVPVTLERSISIFMLGTMKEHADETFSARQMQDVFIDGYVNRNGAMQKRLDEQVISGNVAPVDGGYRITPAGMRLVRILEAVARAFNVNMRLLKP